MASSSAALLAVLVVVSCAGMAAATSYTVGDTKGWVTGVDYSGWTSGKSFAVGDTLVFSYASKVHTVTEVSQGGYTSCSGSNALANDDSGATTVTLATPGTHYYICNIPGHCASGMKLAVTVAGGGSSPGGSTPSGASAGGSLAPAMGAVVAAAAGALIKVALF
ncbi:mavicyanin [Aegilops tauschii subsp. strangulata]|uniref:Phytocyanin domain-containing protein n=1 Tax=Aegilops tauschii subsp. strangulata TaxID=200361 RepID=A0A453L0L5_AEGTS|nr:mavicyanin [Aegilops tauschii subsp. strangulata]